MACEILTSGVTIGCDNNMGGLNQIYITDYNNVSAYATNDSGQITGFTMVTGTTFFEYEFNRGTSEFIENELINIENGSAYYEQMVNLVIPKRDVTKRNQIKLLAQRKLIIIVKDGNDSYTVGGLGDGFLLTELTSGSGLAKADGSKYTLAFKAEEVLMAPFATAAAVTAVI